MSFRVWDKHPMVQLEMPREIVEYLLNHMETQGGTGVCGIVGDSEWQHLYVGAKHYLHRCLGTSYTGDGGWAKQVDEHLTEQDAKRRRDYLTLHDLYGPTGPAGA